MNDGGPAFPKQPIYYMPDGTSIVSEQGGMSLRDYFAAKALVGLGGPSHLSNIDSRDIAYKGWAQNAYLVADAMLKARES